MGNNTPERQCLVVVGGYPDHFEKMARKIRERGFNAEHWGKLGEQKLSSNAAAMLVCNDVCTAPMQDYARKQAKRFGTPVLLGSAMSWSGWVVQLDALKIVSKLPPEKTGFAFALEAGEAAAKARINQRVEAIVAEAMKTIDQPVMITVQQPKEKEMVMNTAPATSGTPRNRVASATREIYLDWVREAMVADSQVTNRQLAAMLTERSLKTFGSTLKKYSDKMYTEVREELGVKANIGRRRDTPTMEEKRAAIEKLARSAPGEAIKTYGLKDAAASLELMVSDANVPPPRAVQNSSYEIVNGTRPGSFAEAMENAQAAAFRLPSWPTQDLRDAIEMVRHEMARLHVTELKLTATTCDFKRVVVEEGSL